MIKSQWAQFKLDYCIQWSTSRFCARPTFIFSLHNLSVNAHETNTYCYADDKVLYSCGSSVPNTLHKYSLSLIFCSLSSLNSNSYLTLIKLDWYWYCFIMLAYKHCGHCYSSGEDNVTCYLLQIYLLHLFLFSIAIWNKEKILMYGIIVLSPIYAAVLARSLLLKRLVQWNLPS